MTREQKVLESIKKATENGFVFYKTGTGNYEELFNQKRAEGYVVAAWYVKITKDERVWEIYLKEKKQRASASMPTFTTNPITDMTYYHGVQKAERYDEMTVKALREICKNRKIAGYSKMNKAQMVESLQKAC